MHRREKLRQFLRLELLTAASKVFAERGFHGATLEQIAKEAEVAVGTLYLYFKSKEEMYLSLLEHKCTEFLDQLKQRLKTLNDPLKKLQDYTRFFLEYFEREIEFFSIFIYERSHLGRLYTTKRDYQRIYNLYLQPIEIVTDIIRDAKRAGLIGNYNARDLAVLLNGMLKSMIVSWCIDRKKGRLPGKATLILDTFLSGVKKSATVSGGKR
jgi:TetR/AcrR family transcriptional regulator